MELLVPKPNDAVESRVIERVARIGIWLGTTIAVEWRRMLDRRRFLLAAATVLGTRHALADERAPRVLLQNLGSPQDLSTPLAWFDRLLMPTDVFFVRSHFGPPSLDADRKLAVEGLVTTPLSVTADELRAKFAPVTTTAVLQCAGNGRGLQSPQVPGVQWRHGAMGQATFTGARLFGSRCAACHGVNARGGIGVNLSSSARCFTAQTTSRRRCARVAGRWCRYP